MGVLLALLRLACNSAPTDPGRPLEVRNERVVLSFGSAVEVNDDLRISFAQLVEDSRCPASVVCVWQGNGAARLDITTRRGAQSVTLNTAGSSDMPSEATALGYTFKLVELDPQRQTPDPVPPQQYRATIRVTRVP